MPTSVKGQLAIICEEAIVLQPYDDKGFLAFGIGHRDNTLVVGQPPITVEEAVRIFKDDIKIFEKSLDKILTRPLKQHEYDAMISLMFNTGPTGFKRRVELVDALNAGDRAKVCQELMKIKNLKRRIHEAAMFYSNEYIDTTLVPLYRGDPRDPAVKREEIPLVLT